MNQKCDTMTDLNCHSLYRGHKTTLTLTHTEHLHTNPSKFQMITLEELYLKQVAISLKEKRIFSYWDSCPCGDCYKPPPVFAVNEVDTELAYFNFFQTTSRKFYFVLNKILWACTWMVTFISSCYAPEIFSLDIKKMLLFGEILLVTTKQDFSKNKEQS